MARKHSKKFKKSAAVSRTVLSPCITTKARVVTEVPAGTPNAIPVTQDDGSVKHFVVEPKVIKPAVVKVMATEPTTTKGQRNDPKNMAPKGKQISKSAPGGKK
jgi:hypothetical protein